MPKSSFLLFCPGERLESTIELDQAQTNVPDAPCPALSIAIVHLRTGLPA
ncbi:MAG: hypothetical protein AB8B35_02160 [Prochlorococcus sp.]